MNNRFFKKWLQNQQIELDTIKKDVANLHKTITELEKTDKKISAYIIGAGALARQIFSVFHNQVNFIGFLDTPKTENEKIYGLPVQETPTETMNVAIGVAHPAYKRRLWKKYVIDKGCSPLTLKHPTAIISDTATFGQGCIFMPYSIVGAETKLGNAVHLAANALIGHNSTVGNFSTLYNFATISGHCIIKEDVIVFLNATVITSEKWRARGKVTLGKGCIVGAGAVVTKSVTAGKTVIGVPAKEKKS